MLKRIKELQEEKYNAEARALMHFRKLYAIENIIRKEEAKKTPTVFIIEAIKKELAKDYQSQN